MISLHHNSRRATVLGSLIAPLLLAVCIIAGLILLSIPGFAKQREDIRREVCVRTLATILAAKVHYASDNDLAPGTPITMEQLTQHGKTFDAQHIPLLPIGAGDLRIGTVGEQPSCEYGGERLYPMPALIDTIPPAEG
jgi:competence protein ComGC